MPQYPLNIPLGAQVSSAIDSNTTTQIPGRVFAGLLVGTAGDAWEAAIYNGNPASGGTLLVTLSADTVGAVPCPLLACPQGLYIETSGTTAGSLTATYYS